MEDLLKAEASADELYDIAMHLLKEIFLKVHRGMYDDAIFAMLNIVFLVLVSWERLVQCQNELKSPDAKLKQKDITSLLYSAIDVVKQWHSRVFLNGDSFVKRLIPGELMVFMINLL